MLNADGEVKVGDPAPAVDALFADGSPYDPAHVKGKFVLMTWWPADDEAAKKHFGVLRRIRREYLDEQRLQMISIKLDGEFEDWLRFLDRQSSFDPKFPMRSFYSDAKWWQAFHSSPGKVRRNPFHVGARPQSFLIGPDGKLVAVDIPDAKLRETVKAALAKR
jgi:hypothetical protein